MKIRDLMHKGVEAMPPDTPIIKLAKKMREEDIGSIPVGTKDQLLGIVTDRDITLRAVADGNDITKLTAQDVMTKGVVCCRDTEKVRDVMRTMEAKQIRRIPVLDEHEHLVGMISLGDISDVMPDKATGEIMKAVSAHHA